MHLSTPASEVYDNLLLLRQFVSLELSANNGKLLIPRILDLASGMQWRGCQRTVLTVSKAYVETPDRVDE